MGINKLPKGLGERNHHQSLSFHHQPSIEELAFTREDRVGDGGDLAVEILEGKTCFKMQIAGFKAFGTAGGQALQVTFAAFSLTVGEFGFFLDQPAGNPDIMGDEYIAGECDICDDTVMHSPEFIQPFGGEVNAVFGAA